MLRVSLRTTAALAGAVIVGTYVIFGVPGDRRKKKRRKDTIPGLANVGNSCFLNALVQSLASCPLFIAWLQSKLTDPPQPVVSTLLDLLNVLNNEGGAGGDACAGEVMRALRNHGWVISMEEQDTHELFHALSATIDDEISNNFSTPSLLDVSWLQEGQGGVEGVLQKAVSVEALPEYSSLRDNTQLDSLAERSSSTGDLSCMTVGDMSCMTGGDFSCKRNGSVSEIEPSLYGYDTDSVSSDMSPSKGRMKSDITQDESCGAKDGDKINDEQTVSDKTIINSRSENEKLDESETCEVKPNINGSGSECNTIEESQDTVDKHADKGTNKDCLKDHVESVNCNNKTENVNEDEGEIKTEEEERGLEDRFWKGRSDQQDTPFRGYLASQLQCMLCGHKNPAQWTSFESLSLSLPSLPWGEVTLQELLDSYITHEKVTEVTCDACSKKAGCDVKTSFTKRLTVGKLPDCLCFHIKRTLWLDNGTAVKRRDHVTFPEFLTMDPYTYTASLATQPTLPHATSLTSHATHPHATSLISHATHPLQDGAEKAKGSSTRDLSLPPLQPASILSHHATSTSLHPSSFVHVSRVRCEQLYRLKAVIVHVGDIFCGHFVTYRRGPLGSRTRNRWYYTSDLLVREASLEEVRKTNAYMILYEKVTQ